MWESESIVYYLTVLFVLLLSYTRSLYILDTGPVSDMWCANVFPSLCFDFILWILSFEEQILSLDGSLFD